MNQQSAMTGLSWVVVVPLGCLLGLIWLWVRVLRKPKHYHAVCGRCQYIVEGLQTMFCPECGSDFRKVGIQTPDKRGRVEPTIFLAVWTVLLLPVAMLIGFLTLTVGPQKVNASTSFGLAPTSLGFGEVTITARYASSRLDGAAAAGLSSPGSSNVGSRHTITFPQLTPTSPPNTIDLSVSASRGSMPSLPGPKLRVYPGSGGYRLARPTGELVYQPEGFSPTVVEEWFLASGLRPESSNLPDDAADLFGLVNAYGLGQASFTTTRFAFSGGGSSQVSSMPQNWFLGAVVVFWLLVYVAGILLYRRARLRQAVEEAVATA